MQDLLPEIEELIGIIRTNSVSLRPRIEFGGEARGHGIFPLFSIFSHHCMANSRFVEIANHKIRVA